MKTSFLFPSIIALALSLISAAAISDVVTTPPVDHLHYKAELEPDFSSQSLTGKVEVRFQVNNKAVKQLAYSALYKQIKSVIIDGKTIAFTVKDEQLKINFAAPLVQGKEYLLQIDYKATPKRGMKFYPDHLFTVYHTKNWLISHNDIADKASFELLLTHAKALTSAGNGELISTTKLNNGKVVSHWHQPTPIPVYTFGFALGEFEKHSEQINDKKVSYLYRKQANSGLTKTKVKNAFGDVADMLAFFTEKAGFPMPAKSYDYVIVNGYMAQEADGYSLVGEKFVHTVLENKNENWFIAHELAHEWWGNNITCANFSHFWLNEGLVQFLVAAYKEHLFGKEAYKQEINVAINRVNRAVEQDRIAPVAFKAVINEQDINRTMAYSKGALIFYMLRNQLGDDVFWLALKHYSQSNKHNSVTTQSLIKAFEQTSGKDLNPFFERWVYGSEIPQLVLD